ADLLLRVDAREAAAAGHLGEPVHAQAPTSLAVQEIAARLGGVECEVHFAGDDRTACRLVATAPLPTLVLGAEVAAVPLSRRARFKIARALYLVRERVLGELDCQTIEQAVYAAARELDHEFLPP